MMSKLQRKLRSRTGASMLLALVFLLFCSFVGGSVLVSATANAYRVAHIAEQQDFLNQRSAALLLSDRLQLNENQRLYMTVINANRSVQQVEVNENGSTTAVGEPQTELVITFQLEKKNINQITEMQRLMLETTIWRFLQENLESDKVYKVKLLEFGSEMTGLDKFWYSCPGVTVLSTYTEDGQKVSKVKLADRDAAIQGTMDVSGTWQEDVGGAMVNLPAYTANFSSSNGEDLYDFTVDFGDLTQLRMTMNASCGTNSPRVMRMPATEGHMPDSTEVVNIEVTTTSVTTSISWKDPKVEKGGALG